MSDFLVPIDAKRFRRIQLLIETGSWNRDPVHFINTAIDRYIDELRPDVVGDSLFQGREFEAWEPYPFDPDNPEHLALYEKDGRFDMAGWPEKRAALEAEGTE